MQSLPPPQRASAFTPSDTERNIEKLRRDLKRRQWIFFIIVIFLFILGLLAMVFGAIWLAKQVDSEKIAENTIQLNDLNQQTTDFLRQVPDSSIGTDQLADLAIDVGIFSDDSITGNKLADGSVTSAKIVDGAVVTDEIAPGAVTAAKITDREVTELKLSDAVVEILNNTRDMTELIDTSDEMMRLGVADKDFSITRPLGPGTDTFFLGQSTETANAGSPLYMHR